MEKDEAFRRAIEKKPGDDALRLVYADWLEERDDLRGEYLRLAHALDGLALSDPQGETLHARLRELQNSIEPQWVNLVTSRRASLRYHRRTFALLNEKPVLSIANVRKIEKWEKQRGVRLPASVREWYSLEGAEPRLGGRGEELFPLTLQRALNRVARLPPQSSALVFLVGYFDPGEVSVRFEGSDDPPVDFGDDPRGQTFSAFALHRVWNKLTHFEESYYWGSWEDDRSEVNAQVILFQANEPVFGKGDLSYLRQRFTEGPHQLVAGSWRSGIHPITREPWRLFAPPSVLRFFGPTVWIQIICQGNPERRRVEAHWDIGANSSQDLVDAVAQHLWTHRTLSQTLTASTKAGNSALAAIRRRFRASK